MRALLRAVGIALIADGGYNVVLALNEGAPFWLTRSGLFVAAGLYAFIASFWTEDR